MAGILGLFGVKVTDKYRDAILSAIEKNPIPGENFVSYVPAQEKPSNWYFLIIGAFSGFLTKFHLLALTDKRLFIFDTDLLSNIKSFTPYNYQELQLIKLTKGFLETGLQLQFPDGSKRIFSVYNRSGGKATVDNIAMKLSGLTLDQLKQQGKIGGGVGKVVTVICIALFAILVLFLLYH